MPPRGDGPFRPPKPPGGWRFWIDRGGTFTDVVACPPSGPPQVRKVLSVQPGRVGDPAVRAMADLLGLPPEAPWPPGLVEEVRLGTTVATNALLERASAPVLLLVTAGLADLLAIGDQHRPELFALRIERPQPLDVRVVEVEGRLAADGQEVTPLRLDSGLAERIRQVLAAGPRQLAVALLHSWREPAQERQLGDWLERQGFGVALLSHQLSRQPRLLPRAATTVVEAGLEPVLRRYLRQVEQALGAGPRLRVMTSSGDLRSPALLRAKDTILSGPAGGMVGAVAVARRAGWGEVSLVGFDMGGTSTDVFHFDPARGALAWEPLGGTEVAGLPLVADLLPIHTVAAGGGSVLQAVEGRLLVGPRSAGADPGPACYRRGGPATVTDANLVLGRLPVEALPPVFGPTADQPADRKASEQRLAELAEALALTPEQVALGALQVAVERMAEAIRRISIQRGHDLRQALLVCFGGAGGQQACALASRLGVGRVLLHPLAGVLSAYGIGLAAPQLRRERSLRLPLAPGDHPSALGTQLRARVAELVAEGRRDLEAAGDLAPAESPSVTVRLELRTAASEQVLEVEGTGLLAGEAAMEDRAWIAGLRERFEELHGRRFGHRPKGEGLVLERLVVGLQAGGGAEGRSGVAGPPGGGGEATASVEGNAAPEGIAGPEGLVGPESLIPFCLADPGSPRGEAVRPLWVSVPLWRRAALRPGQRLEGPAVVVEPTSTVVVEPGWRAEVLAGGELLLETLGQGSAPEPFAGATGTATSAPPDPVRLELYNHRFSAIAEQMGVRLQQSSRSVNIRERLDFSCALFDRHGRLVANAPHIPVHLGSMGDSVTALLAAIERRERPPLVPGDVIAANDPFHGGTHLPDVTVITPVFLEAGDHRVGNQPVAFVACRGHHADVGGLTPGSMPAFSRRIEEEGLLLDNVPLLSAGLWDEEAWLARCAAGPHPVRNPRRFLADLRAQVAANQLGSQELRRLMAEEGSEEVVAYMGHGQRQAAAAVRVVIDRLRDGRHVVELDSGARIAVAVWVDHQARRVRVDFSGTSPQRDTNLNAPLAITKAAVMYVFRSLVEEPLPLNAGCFDPIDLVVPRGSLLWPDPPAAVVAGNVETSQAIANALYGALGVMAAAQGTMNNLSFGDGERQYYETICGGAGAGLDRDGTGFNGASAVQTHMTNSRLTDVEILEERFPVRLERFQLRRGSGGSGRWRGGDGVERWLRFLAPMTVCLLSGSRRVPPFGLAGGEPGQPGENEIQRAGCHWTPLLGCAQVEMEAGDVLRIATPGGGGFGEIPSDPDEESPTILLPKAL
ncbi:MAG: hydantoinase B/oxoprolinase family protein [Cyanobacteriota bacterium]|nr:hydantoinase B/oxoprolinase family protein [Cyanobacteriota bacterium]